MVVHILQWYIPFFCTSPLTHFVEGHETTYCALLLYSGVRASSSVAHSSLMHMNSEDISHVRDCRSNTVIEHCVIAANP